MVWRIQLQMPNNIKGVQMKKQTIPEKVYKHLKKKKVACTKDSICNALKMKKTSVDRACRILRKEKKVGFIKSSYSLARVKIVKTYWGVK